MPTAVYPWTSESPKFHLHCSGFLVARQPGMLKGKPKPISFPKQTQKYFIAFAYLRITTHAAIFLPIPFLFLFIGVTQCNLLENSCCQRGRLGDLSHAQYKNIKVGALSSALKFFLFFQLPVPVPCLLPWLEQWPFRLNLTTHNSCCYCRRTSLMRSQSNLSVPAYRASLF